MQCLILAGGFATRLWPLTEGRSKPLLPLAGKPLLTHLAEKLPPDMPLTVSTNAAFGKDVQGWAKEQRARKISVYVEDAGHEKEKLGALGALATWIADQKIDDDLLLLAGDNYVGFSLQDFLAAYDGHPLLAAHDVGDLAHAKRFGTVILESQNGTSGRVAAFEEKPAHPRSTLVSTGCYVLPKETLPVLVTYAQSHPDNIGGVFEEFLRQSIPVDCRVFTDAWRDIGSFHAYLETHDMLLDGKTITGDGTTVDAASRLTGSVAIGKNCTIEGSELKNCIVFDDCKISDCVLEDCILDERCRLTGVDLRGKMLRRGTRLVRT